jgi:hypothetical protein
MSRWFTSAKLFVLCLFLASCLAALVYEWRYVWPVQACDQRGAWWDGRDRQCLTPMPIWRITGRLPTKVMAAGTPVLSTPRSQDAKTEGVNR